MGYYLNIFMDIADSISHKNKNEILCSTLKPKDGNYKLTVSMR